MIAMFSDFVLKLKDTWGFCLDTDCHYILVVLIFNIVIQFTKEYSIPEVEFVIIFAFFTKLLFLTSKF